MLSSALFMLEIYDRVLPSRSMPTLVGLTILVAGLLMAIWTSSTSIADEIEGKTAMTLLSTQRPATVDELAERHESQMCLVDGVFEAEQPALSLKDLRGEESQEGVTDAEVGGRDAHLRAVGRDAHLQDRARHLDRGDVLVVGEESHLRRRRVPLHDVRMAGLRQHLVELE